MRSGAEQGNPDGQNTSSHEGSASSGPLGVLTESPPRPSGMLETGKRAPGLRDPWVRDAGERDPGVLLVLSGPSGSGKSTLARAAMERFDNLAFSVSYTTRAPREGEVNGRDYTFVDEATFDQALKDDALAEWAVVHGHRYGTPLHEIRSRTLQGINLLLDIDPQGAKQIQQRYPQAIFIFFVPPSLAVLEARLRGRGTDSPATIERRLRNALGEIREASWYDYLIVNDKLENALEKFCAVILAEKCRRSRSARLLEKLRAGFGLSPEPAHDPESV